jgi:hypothetical protein
VHHVTFVGAPEGFYETSLTVSAALYIAIAVELRLLRPRRIKLPEDPKQRRRLVHEAIFYMSFAVISLVGFVAGGTALYQGGTVGLGDFTMFGFSATLVSFAMLSLRVFFSVLGQAVPWSSGTKGLIALIAVAAMLGVLIYLLVANPTY